MISPVFLTPSFISFNLSRLLVKRLVTIEKLTAFFNLSRKISLTFIDLIREGLKKRFWGGKVFPDV